MTAKAGARLGPYELIAPLGAGSMGEVWRARDQRLGRELAIKLLPEAERPSPRALARLLAEARAASALNHPNIVTIYELGEAAGRTWIAMELCDGKSLREIADAGALPTRRALDIGHQIAEGLAAAHAQGCVHRDLKPENIVVTHAGVVKILDFGLAGPSPAALSGAAETDSATESRTLTAEGVILGTVGYMSPEQARGARADFRSDQFTLGAILYELFSGRRAFRRPTSAETLTAILREEPPSLASARSGIPAAAVRLVLRCLEKEPDARYASTRDLAHDLGELAEGDSSSALARTSRRTAARPGLVRIRWTLVIGSAAIAGILAGRALEREPRASETGPIAIPTQRYLTFLGGDSEPALSPDGRLLAFTSRRSSRREIYLKQLSDGSDTRLTSGDDFAPRFFPDGATLLFTRSLPEGEALFGQAVLGGVPHKLVDRASVADVSPDGRRIAFLRSAGATSSTAETAVTEVVVREIASGAERLVLSAPYLTTPPRFSPDGEFLVIARRTGLYELGDEAEIERIRLADGRRERIDSADLRALSAIDFVGDSDHWLVIDRDPSPYSASARILGLDLDGRVRPLLSIFGAGLTIETLGAGRIVVDPHHQRMGIYTAAVGEDPKVLASKAASWIRRGNAIDRQAAIARDGTAILSSAREGNLELWRGAPEGGDLRLTHDPGVDAEPAFGADERRIYWSSNRTGHFELFTALADGSSAEQLTHLGADAGSPSLPADGSAVYFSVLGGAAPGLYRIAPGGGEPERLLDDPLVVAPAVAPDGGHVAFFSPGAAGRVRFFSVARHAILPIAWHTGQGDPGRIGELGRPRWFPGGTEVAFLGVDEESRAGIFGQRFDPARDTTRTRRKLAGFSSGIAFDSFAIAPDGSYFYLSPILRNSDLMLIEGLPVDAVPGLGRPAASAQ